MKILFYTSLGMGLDIVWYYSSKTYIKWLYFTGVLTSILNYSMDNKEYYKVLDRTVMTVGGCIDLYYIVYNNLDGEYIFFLILSISCYFLSKLTKVVFFHVCAHYFISILHCKILKLSM